jgi:hypothetical protein
VRRLVAAFRFCSTAAFRVWPRRHDKSVSAANVSDAAHMAQHFAELIGALPRHRERANPAAADPTDRVVFGVIGDAVRLANLGQDFR